MKSKNWIRFVGALGTNTAVIASQVPIDSVLSFDRNEQWIDRGLETVDFETTLQDVSYHYQLRDIESTSNADNLIDLVVDTLAVDKISPESYDDYQYGRQAVSALTPESSLGSLKNGYDGVNYNAVTSSSDDGAKILLVILSVGLLVTVAATAVSEEKYYGAASVRW